MDWNKTKTIFIVVFSILNVFLYSLYLDRYTEAQNVQLMGETTIEESLQLDNITIGDLPAYDEESSYVSAKISTFSEDELRRLENILGKQKLTKLDETRIISNLDDPYPLRNAKGDYDFAQFLTTFVSNGTEYVMWEVDEEKRQALFFQTVKDYPIYFNINAMLIVYWDAEENITKYEQSMFGEFVSFNKKNDLLSPIEAINTLYSRDYLKRDSTVKIVSLGYSTHTQLTQTQVFAPTWHVRVELEDGEIEDHFINAREGKIIQFQDERSDDDLDYLDDQIDIEDEKGLDEINDLIDLEDNE